MLAVLAVLAVLARGDDVLAGGDDVLARGDDPPEPPVRFAPRLGCSPYFHAAGGAGRPLAGRVSAADAAEIRRTTRHLPVGQGVSLR